MLSLAKSPSAVIRRETIVALSQLPILHYEVILHKVKSIIECALELASKDSDESVAFYAIDLFNTLIEVEITVRKNMLCEKKNIYS